MTQQTSHPSTRIWTLPAARSAAALAVGLVVPFIEDHSSAVGLVAATVFFGLTAIALAALRHGAGVARGRFRLLSGIHSLAAVAALALLMAVPEPWAFAVLVATWAFASAAVEWAAGRQDARGRRDWRTVAAGTAAFGLIVAVSPLLGMADAVSLTGLFAAYAAVVGVFHAIAAASLGFGSRITDSATSDTAEAQS